MNFPISQTIQQEAYEQAKNSLLILLQRKAKQIKFLEGKEMDAAKIKKIKTYKAELSAIISYLQQLEDFLESVFKFIESEQERTAILQKQCDLYAEKMEYDLRNGIGLNKEPAKKLIPGALNSEIKKILNK